MPELIWDSKSVPEPDPARFDADSIIYPGGNGYPHGEPANQLFFGDNLEVMSALLPEYENRINLIYADPPFFTNRRYPVRVGRGEDSRKPHEWQLAEGYQDHWPDLEAYLDMLYPRLQLMYRLLAPDGSLYLHLDWHASAYARLLLDEIFGPQRLLNEIAWVYHGPSPIRSAFNRKHDTILVYTKGSDYTFNVDDVRIPYDASTVRTFESSEKAGFGKVPDLERGKVPEDWWYFPVVARLHNERTGYPTQKPEALLERIVLASSNPGDLVADFFCGSGTMTVVADRLDRRFIACDATWRAVHVTKTRLVRIGAQAFEIKLNPAAHPDRNVVTVHEDLQDTSQKPADVKDTPFSLQSGVLYLKKHALPEVDYWEVDPAWDGKLFRSAAQAVRPLRKGQVKNCLEIPSKLQSGRLCARVVQADGQQNQFILTRGPA